MKNISTVKEPEKKNYKTMETHNDADYIVGSGILAAASWATAIQPYFSLAASIAAIVVSVMGIVNYVKKWKERKN